MSPLSECQVLFPAFIALIASVVLQLFQFPSTVRKTVASLYSNKGSSPFLLAELRGNCSTPSSPIQRITDLAEDPAGGRLTALVNVHCSATDHWALSSLFDSQLSRSLSTRASVALQSPPSSSTSLLSDVLRHFSRLVERFLRLVRRHRQRDRRAR